MTLFWTIYSGMRLYKIVELSNFISIGSHPSTYGDILPKITEKRIHQFDWSCLQHPALRVVWKWAIQVIRSEYGDDPENDGVCQSILEGKGPAEAYRLSYNTNKMFPANIANNATGCSGATGWQRWSLRSGGGI